MNQAGVARHSKQDIPDEMLVHMATFCAQGSKLNQKELEAIALDTINVMPRQIDHNKSLPSLSHCISKILQTDDQNIETLKTALTNNQSFFSKGVFESLKNVENADQKKVQKAISNSNAYKQYCSQVIRSNSKFWSPALSTVDSSVEGNHKEALKQEASNNKLQLNK